MNEANRTISPATHHPKRYPFGISQYVLLDEQLAAGQRYSQIRGQGFTNHSSLTAEALIFLNRPDAAKEIMGEDDDGWYPREPGLQLNPAATGSRLSRHNLATAFGDGERLGDLNEFFEAETRSLPPGAVIDRYVPLLASDVSADLYHGVIQVAHAVRALVVGDTPVRRRELARGLALWAARYEPLSLPTGGSGSSVSAMLGELPSITVGPHHGLRNNIESVLADRALNRLIGRVEVGSPADAVLDVASGLATMFNTEVPRADGPPANQILLLHTVTGAQAVLSLLPLVDRATQETLTRSLVTTSAAMAVTYRADGLERPAQYSRPRFRQLQDVAGLGREAHVAKAVAAAVALSAHRPDRSFADFAIHASRAMDPTVVERSPDAQAVWRSGSSDGSTLELGSPSLGQ